MKMPAARGFPGVDIAATRPPGVPVPGAIQNTVQLKASIERTMTEDQFAELKRQIETSDLSVEQIRAYRPPAR